MMINNIETFELPENIFNTAFTNQMSTWGLHRFNEQQITARTDELLADFFPINFCNFLTRHGQGLSEINNTGCIKKS
jgi:hypothetical protein